MLPLLGREFMPALEEGNLWIRGTAPLNISLERHTEISQKARAIMATYPEVESIVNQLGRPDDAHRHRRLLQQRVLRPPAAGKRLAADSWRRPAGGTLDLRAPRARTKEEIVEAMNAELDDKLPGINWNFSQNIRDNVMEALSGIKGDNSVKIIGPDLDQAGDAGRPRSRTSCSRSTASRTSASSTSAASRTWSSASIRKSASDGACRRPTSTTSSERARRPGPVAA